MFASHPYIVAIGFLAVAFVAMNVKLRYNIFLDGRDQETSWRSVNPNATKDDVGMYRVLTAVQWLGIGAAVGILLVVNLSA